MRSNINSVFRQIIGISVDSLESCMFKDIKLQLGERADYDVSQCYKDAYCYLYDCLLLDKGKNNRQKLLDRFLIHQYLCHCYLSEEVIDNLAENTDDLKMTIEIIRECFFIYRLVGAFQTCTEQYEILRKSTLWQKLSRIQQMQIMKEAAKSYRNRGDFSHALDLYFSCLKLNDERDWLQRVELLLKIGKVYRNYLMQVELARFYVEEAYTILKENGTASLSEKTERRYAVICFDTLGQIYRDEADYGKAEQFFKESERLYNEEEGRARIHKTLMQYQKEPDSLGSNLKKDIEFMEEVISNLQKNPMDEIGIGIRSVQLGQLLFKDPTRQNGEAYKAVRRGRYVAHKYNDMKTVIRSYMEEAGFLKQERKYAQYVEVSKKAVRIAADNSQLVLENKIIKEIIEVSNDVPDIIDSAAKIDLIRRRKDIYKKLVAFSRFSIDIVREGMSDFFTKDKLIDMYGIVRDDYEQILGELDAIIEILNIEIEKINQKYVAYLNTEIKGFTYKSILHKFKNDLPDEKAINELRSLCSEVQTKRIEGKEILAQVDKQLETFANIITHIKQSASETLKESEAEKKWCSLDDLIRVAIHNFVWYKPQYETIIQYRPAAQRINILVQSTLFETTVSEILNNAFDYAESAIENGAETKFQFVIDVNIIEKRTVILDCYSEFADDKAIQKAEASIKKGLRYKKSTKKNGSRYGLQSMKLLFEDIMGGEIQVKRAGISIHLPVNLVTLEIADGDKTYE